MTDRTPTAQVLLWFEEKIRASTAEVAKKERDLERYDADRQGLVHWLEYERSKLNALMDAWRLFRCQQRELAGTPTEPVIRITV